MRNLNSLGVVGLSVMFAAESGQSKGAAPVVVNPFDAAFHVQSFKRGKSKDTSYDEGVTTLKRLADVILEIKGTGMIVSGVNITRVKHMKDNGSNKAGKIELVMKWPNKGKQAGYAQILVAETNESQANLDAFAARIKGEFDAWYSKDVETRAKAAGPAAAEVESYVPTNAAIYA